MRKTLTAALVIFAVCTFGSAHASLIDNGNNLIYDTVLDITWYANPNYETHVCADYTAWAAGLTVGGVTNWRLPTTPGTTTGITSEGEMGHLFYITLGNTTGVDGVGQPIGLFTNKGPFTALNGGFYTQTYAGDGKYYYFNFDDGKQSSADVGYWYYHIHGLAVHEGNIGGSSVPIPGAVWLLGSGLIGLIGVRRFRK
jgi:hypothetical protein